MFNCLVSHGLELRFFVIMGLFLTISFHFRTSFEALAKDKKLFHFRFLEQFNFIMTILLSKII